MLVMVFVFSLVNIFVFWEWYFLWLKKRLKVNVLFLKGDSSVVSEEVFKCICNKILKIKCGKKCGWNVYFLKEMYEMFIILF